MTAADLLTRLSGVAKITSGWQARCPAHEDSRASLSITDGEKGAVLHCFAGCKTENICSALGIKLSDLFNSKPKRDKLNIIATYDYTDETGQVLFQVCRFDPKNFKQRRPDPTAPDGWIWKKGRKVLFRLPHVRAAVADGRPIFVVEGEKDVLAMESAGFCATCNSEGAIAKPDDAKWPDSISKPLRGAEVVILPDRDEPGKLHAQLVARKLQGIAGSIRVVELPANVDGKPVKDAHDYFSAGGQAADLDALAQAAPFWTPPIEPAVAPEPGGSTFDEVTEWVRSQLIKMFSDRESLPTVKHSVFAGQVVQALQRLGRFYHHAELNDFDSAMWFDGTRKRLERIRSDAFLAWLSQWLLLNRSNGVFKYVQSAVETASLGRDSTPILPEAYWASRPGSLFLSTGDGQALKITAGGVQAVDNGTDSVLFAVGSTLAQWKLTEPRDPFETCALFRNVHSGADHGKDLLRLWTYSFATMPRSKPPLGAVGEVGSGKTRTLKGICELYGLPFRAAKVEEALEPNFWPSVNQGGLYVLDNADSKCRWLADAVASAATDGCSVRRRLYTDSQLVTLRANSWLAITSANPTFGNDAGLADRLLLLRMERRPDGTSDAALTDEILANRDAGLSHIAQTLSAALGDTKPTPGNLNARHPDFGNFAARIGRALNRETEAITALRNAEADKSAFCLENDGIAAALLAYVQSIGSFIGTAAQLLPHLVAVDRDLDGKVSAKRLGKRLSALWPHLQKALDARKETDRKGFAVFTFKVRDALDLDYGQQR
jgi:5S rRNA maturation endonuclease (ribonuclease M5)